jgi:hypothetical protein
MLRMEAVAASLAEILGELPPELEDALDGGSPVTARKTLATSGGKIEIEVQVPAPGQQPDSALLEEDGTLDDDRVDAYRRSFLGRFEASPEAKAEPAAHWGALLVDYAASYFGEPLSSLSSLQFREIVFEIIPRKVSVAPEAAPEIVAGLRALLAFVRREYPASQAEACLRSLEGNASQRLARLLADPANFGPAKSFVMGGRAAGFDMSSQSGMDAWALHMRRNDLRLPVGFPPPQATRSRNAVKPPPSQPAKKAKRKAAQKARKKTRSR